MLVHFISIFMPIFLRSKNYIEFLIQSLKIVRNMQNSMETRGNLCTELGPLCFVKSTTVYGLQ